MAANVESNRLAVLVTDIVQLLLGLLPCFLLLQNFVANFLKCFVLGLVPRGDLGLVVRNCLVDLENLAHLLVDELFLKVLQLRRE